MANNTENVSGLVQQLAEETSNHVIIGTGNPGVDGGNLIVSDIRDALEHLPASVTSYLDNIFGRVGETVSEALAHHQPLEAGIDPRLLTGPTPDKGTTVTLTSWPSFWDHIDGGDHNIPVETFSYTPDGHPATSETDHDSFNMFRTEAGIDQRLLTGPTPTKGTIVTLTSWGQNDGGDHNIPVETFSYTPDGHPATSETDYDPFNMFPTGHPHWLLS